MFNVAILPGQKKSTIVLVLSGGAITGGLQALNGLMLNRNIVDFDMLIGTSAGSFLTTYLANGITTDQLANSFEGKQSDVDPIMISERYALNLKDALTAPAHIAEHITPQAVKNIIDFIKTNFYSSAKPGFDINKLENFLENLHEQ